MSMLFSRLPFRLNRPVILLVIEQQLRLPFQLLKTFCAGHGVARGLHDVSFHTTGGNSARIIRFFAVR